MLRGKILFGIVAAVLVIAYMSFYIVDQRERALLFRLGEIIKSDIKPGLHFKFPFVNNVRTFDARILTLNARPRKFFDCGEKECNGGFLC